MKQLNSCNDGANGRHHEDEGEKNSSPHIRRQTALFLYSWQAALIEEWLFKFTL
jgi:hypothetical protein